MEHINIPVSDHEVLIIKKILNKGKEKNYSKYTSDLIYKIINIKFIFIMIPLPLHL